MYRMIRARPMAICRWASVSSLPTAGPASCAPTTFSPRIMTPSPAMPACDTAGELGAGANRRGSGRRRLVWHGSRPLVHHTQAFAHDPHDPKREVRGLLDHEEETSFVDRNELASANRS